MRVFSGVNSTLWLRRCQKTRSADNRENWLYQQIISTRKFNRARLIHRYRIEERWATGCRLCRYLASLRRPLGPKSDPNPKRYLALKDKICISNQPNPFDSNRVWGGVARIFNKNLGGELLWLTQFDGGQNRSNCVAFLLRHTFGWSSDYPERRVRFLPQ